ncbi:MAG TPA: NfeD family protein [Jiangellaceae bacterium]|nr:NfeD family protein [Jiangellaceae bacterium]
MSWLVWLAAAVVLGVAEFFTLTLGLGILAAAAVIAAVVAGLGLPLIVQVLAFVLTAAGGLLIVRPIARRHMRQPPLTRDGSEALLGRQAVVVQEVTAFRGLVKVAGEEWSARALDESQVIPVGALVDVMEIDGATAVVYPRDLLP